MAGRPTEARRVALRRVSISVTMGSYVLSAALVAIAPLPLRAESAAQGAQPPPPEVIDGTATPGDADHEAPPPAPSSSSTVVEPAAPGNAPPIVGPPAPPSATAGTAGITPSPDGTNAAPDDEIIENLDFLLLLELLMDYELLTED